MGGAQLCDAVIRDIVQNWVRAFRRGPPRVQCTQVPSLAVGISADEGVLRRLAARFGAEAIWVNLPSTEEPLQPLREVRQSLRLLRSSIAYLVPSMVGHLSMRCVR